MSELTDRISDLERQNHAIKWWLVYLTIAVVCGVAVGTVAVVTVGIVLTREKVPLQFAKDVEVENLIVTGNTQLGNLVVKNNTVVRSLNVRNDADIRGSIISKDLLSEIIHEVGFVGRYEVKDRGLVAVSLG